MILKHNVPLYQEIYAALQNAILSGRLAPGQRLPPLRQLASLFLANPNTIQRAAQELQRDGFLNAYSRKGYFVTSDLDLIARCRKAREKELLQTIHRQMNDLGHSPAELPYLFEQFKGREYR